jgi:hypothetical protein
MSTEISDLKQSKTEVRKYATDFTDDLPATVTVASATATHTPPSGSASTPTVAVATPIVNVTLGPLSVTGLHVLDILATYSDSEKSAVRLMIEVAF